MVSVVQGEKARGIRMFSRCLRGIGWVRLDIPDSFHTVRCIFPQVGAVLVNLWVQETEIIDGDTELN